MGSDLSALFAYLAFAALVNWFLYRAARESIRARRRRRAARIQSNGARVYRITTAARLDALRRKS